KEIKFHQPQSDLTKHTQTIEAYFRENPPATIKEAMAKIEELTGIKRSETQVRNYLKSIGFERRSEM
ncbi:transposase, partial [Achromatium sp. WMS1]